MSGAETDNQQAWDEALFDTHEHATPTADHQPGWQLSAIGITVAVMALLMLSV